MSNKLEPIPFTHDPSLDPHRVEVIEAALGPLIDRHMRWTNIEDSPSAGLTDRRYGTLPALFDPNLQERRVSLRPGREPIDFDLIAGEVLGIAVSPKHMDTRIREVDGYRDDPTADETPNGFYGFLVKSGVPLAAVNGMRNVSEASFRLNTLTEDNLPSYVLETMGAVRELTHRFGIKVPALEEWFRGLWPAEEDAHKSSMNTYGHIRNITSNPAHTAGRNSQLRTGTAVRPSGLVEVFCYTPRQEYATKLAHRNDGLLMGPVGYQLTTEISQDETRHEDLYSGVLKALLNDPRLASEVMIILYNSYANFFMPGSAGIPDFRREAFSFVRAKIYGLEEDYIAAKHVLKKIGLFNKDEKGSYVDPAGLSGQAQECLQLLRDSYEGIFETSERSRSAEFVLGVTITENELKALRNAYREEQGLPDLRTRRRVA